MLSRSPEDAGNEDQALDFREANQQLGLLAEQGFSWSGNERNCAFLNTHGGPFANVSAVAGFDFLDDGRSLALVDWDHDGDLDVWSGNRTAPRVRFLRNDTPIEHEFVSFSLRGTTCNRDAVGARVEVVLADRPDEVLVRTLRAGEGFLGQSSKRVHFGLGGSTEISRTTVRWPGGEAEDFTGVQPGRFHVLVQGAGKAEVWTPPARELALEPSVDDGARPSSRARVFLASRPALPPITYQTFDGQSRTHERRDGTPLLVNLWASWCQPCLAELSQMGREWSQLEGAGLDVVALSVDGLGVDESSSVEAAADLMERLALPFATGLATPEQVDTLQIVHDLLLAQRRPLPVPTSFLLDSQGRVSVVYKGQVELEQLLQDVRLLSAPWEEQSAATLPFAGRWLSQTNTRTQLLPLANQLAAAGHVHLAISYADAHGRAVRAEPELARFLADAETDLRSRPVDAATHASLGRVLLLAGRGKEAAAEFRKLRKLSPEFGTEATLGLARAFGAQGDFARALPLFQELIAADPDDARLYARRAELYAGIGNGELAAQDAARVVELQPGSAEAHYALARARHDLGDLDGAASACSAAVDLQFDHAPALLLRGAIHARHGAYEAAMADLTLATRAAPDDAAALAELAWLRATCPEERWRDGTEALTRARRAGELSEWGRPAVLQAFAAASAETGDLPAAIEHQERAIELAPATEKAAYREVLAAFEAGLPYRTVR